MFIAADMNKRFILKSKSNRRGRILPFFVLLLLLLLAPAHSLLAQSNPIVVENSLPGNPASQWDISGAGDLTIQGFADRKSVV